MLTLIPRSCISPLQERETFQRGLGLCDNDVNKLIHSDRSEVKDKFRKVLFLVTNEKEMTKVETIVYSLFI
jgi:hypothetical protein